MSSRSRTSTNSVDWILVSVFFAIVFTGWLMLYTVSYEGQGSWWFSLDSIVGKQTIAIGVALACFILCISLDWRIWSTLSYPIYIVIVFSLIAVLFFGKEVKGASSWFSIMGFSIQPSEFAKFGTALGVSAFLGQTNLNINNISKAFVCFMLFLGPAFLIFLQPDAGTAIIFMSFIYLYTSNVNRLYIYRLAHLVTFLCHVAYSISDLFRTGL